MLILDYLKNHSLSQLNDEYKINFRWDAPHTKVSLNYDTIESKRGCKLVDECRGLILRPQRYDISEHDVCDYSIVARPMKRFYNASESCAANIDLNHCRIFEKLDGTMTILYYDDLFERWCVGTRSVPEADVLISDGSILTLDKTFNDLFWEAAHYSINIAVDAWLSSLDKNKTYIFELTSPLNNILVKYDDTRLTLLAVIDRDTGIEDDILGRNFHCSLPRMFDLKRSCDVITTFVNMHNGLSFEGCVVVDAHYNRIKIKNENYIALSHQVLGVIDDVIGMFSSDIQTMINDKIQKITTFLQHQQTLIESINSFSKSDKEFALCVEQEQNLLKFAAYAIHHKKSATVFDVLTKLAKSNKLTDKLCDSIIKNCL